MVKINKLESDKALAQLAKNIFKYRKLLNLSQEQLAYKCNFDRTYISLLERQKRNITIKNLKKLADGLNITVSKLTEGI